MRRRRPENARVRESRNEAALEPPCANDRETEFEASGKSITTSVDTRLKNAEPGRPRPSSAHLAVPHQDGPVGADHAVYL